MHWKHMSFVTLQLPGWVVKATDESVKGREGSVGIADKEGDYRIQIHTPTLPTEKRGHKKIRTMALWLAGKIQENRNGSEKLARLQAFISWDVHVLLALINDSSLLSTYCVLDLKFLVPKHKYNGKLFLKDINLTLNSKTWIIDNLLLANCIFFKYCCFPIPSPPPQI